MLSRYCLYADRVPLYAEMALLVAEPPEAEGPLSASLTFSVLAALVSRMLYRSVSPGSRLITLLLSVSLVAEFLIWLSLYRSLA